MRNAEMFWKNFTSRRGVRADLAFPPTARQATSDKRQATFYYIGAIKNVKYLTPEFASFLKFFFFKKSYKIRAVFMQKTPSQDQR
jgi:hypothetical protein